MNILFSIRARGKRYRNGRVPVHPHVVDLRKRACEAFMAGNMELFGKLSGELRAAVDLYHPLEKRPLCQRHLNGGGDNE